MPEKLKRKLLTPEKLKHKLLTPWLWTETDGQKKHYMPFHHSLNGEGIKSCSSYNQLRILKCKLLMPSWTQTDRWTGVTPYALGNPECPGG